MNLIRTCGRCGREYAGTICPACPSRSPSEPRADDLQPGRIFHGLEILRKIGEGGMGAVYQSRQPSLDRMVAVKILPPHRATDPDAAGRFALEARALASLSHPHIVGIHDFGTEEGISFLVMEFVDGPSLRDRLGGGRLETGEVVRIARQICDALDYAHGKGIVHRDLKPENILLDREGRVRIADFGLAKLVASEDSARLTQSDAVVGTLRYMAPEQVVSSGTVDHRADLYAVGVLLHEMLTGREPVDTFEPPSGDARIDAVVRQALERDPARRPRSARELAAMLAPRSRRWWPWAAAVAALATAAFFALRGGREVPPRADPPVAEAGLDLSRLAFAPKEGPRGQRPVNHLPALDDFTAWLRRFVKDPALDVSGIRVGVMYVWQGCGVLGLAGPGAEMIEVRLKAINAYAFTWRRRRGDSLVFAWGVAPQDRPVFDDLVALLRGKFGLAE